MAIRLVAGSLLFLAFPVLAQQQQQDPDKPQATPEQQMRELKADKERLQREIQYAKERVGNSKVLLRDKLAGHNQKFRSIDAGTNAPPAPAMPAPQQLVKATVASGDLLADFPNDTIALVNRRPVTQGGLDRLTGYLRSCPNSGTEQQQGERAMYELIRIEAVMAAFEENAAAERAATAAAALHDGRAFAELVKEYGTCQGAAADGKVEVMHNSVFGPMVEMWAFSTKEGTNSPPFRTANGIMIFRAEKLEKGASPELDKMVGYAIQVPYAPEEDTVQKALLAVNMGQVQIIVKEAKNLQLLPPMFRPDPVAPAAQMDISPASVLENAALLERSLNEIGEMIKKLGASTDAAAVEQRKQLELQYAEVKTRLKAAQSGTPAAAPAPVTPAAAADPKALQAAMDAVQAEMKQLSGATDDASKAKLVELSKRYGELKMQMRASSTPQAPQPKK